MAIFSLSRKQRIGRGRGSRGRARTARGNAGQLPNRWRFCDRSDREGEPSFQANILRRCSTVAPVTSTGERSYSAWFCCWWTRCFGERRFFAAAPFAHRYLPIYRRTGCVIYEPRTRNILLSGGLPRYRASCTLHPLRRIIRRWYVGNFNRIIAIKSSPPFPLMEGTVLKSDYAYLLHAHTRATDTGTLRTLWHCRAFTVSFYANSKGASVRCPPRNGDGDIADVNSWGTGQANGSSSSSIPLGSMGAPLTTIVGTAPPCVRAHSSNQTFTVLRLIIYSSIVLLRVIYFHAAQASFQRAQKNIPVYIGTYLRYSYGFLTKIWEQRSKLCFRSAESFTG